MANISLTGFKAFGDLPSNPTEKIIEALSSSTDANHLSQLRILDVSTKAVDAYYDSIDLYNSSSKHLVIHLGVNAGATHFQIEEYAYNSTTFRIPDNEGFQPTDSCISSELPLDSPLKTTFPAAHIINACRINSDLVVELSDDPGRYICNYIYFKSLLNIAQRNESVDVVFIHTPPEEIIPITQQVDFVKNVIKYWSEFHFPK